MVKELPVKVFHELINEWYDRYETSPLYLRPATGDVHSNPGWNMGRSLSRLKVLAFRSGLPEDFLWRLKRGIAKTIDFDRADRLLIAMEMEYEWRERLAPYYCTAEPESELTHNGRPVGGRPFMTMPEIRAAHLVYTQTSISMESLADLVWEKFGYASPDTCATSLSRYFRKYGLRTKTKREASTKHGRSSPLAPIHVQRAYWRERERARRLRERGLSDGPCTATKKTGAPCRCHAQVGKNVCYHHDPERRGELLKSIHGATKRRLDIAQRATNSSVAPAFPSV